MRVLLLSGYDAGSHRYWHQGLRRVLPEHDWTLLTLPARHFNWRLRGAPLGWLHESAPVLRAGYDLVVATSAVDLATLRGLVPELAAVPALLYMHENQFAWPASARQQGLLEAQMVNLYSALAADCVVFNSAYNRDSFLAGADRLLARLPDHRPRALAPLLKRVEVLPVPLVNEALVAPRRDERFLLVWNHRWEYDKGPDRLLLTVRALEAQGVEFGLILLGEQFRRRPEPMETLCREFAHRILHCGYVDRDEYRRLLAGATVALSTALHEFQGVALMEAVAAGALPRAPDRLCYPEWLPPQMLYPAREDPAAEAQGLARQLAEDYRLWQRGLLPPAPSMRDFSWAVLAPRYRRLLAEVAGSTL